MAYAKLDLFDALIKSTGPDDPTFETLLTGYFPDELKKFDQARRRHRLRREIIGTVLDNDVVNRGGPLFMHRCPRGPGSVPDLPPLLFQRALRVGAGGEVLV